MTLFELQQTQTNFSSLLQEICLKSLSLKKVTKWVHMLVSKSMSSKDMEEDSDQIREDFPVILNAKNTLCISMMKHSVGCFQVFYKQKNAVSE